MYYILFLLSLYQSFNLPPPRIVPFEPTLISKALMAQELVKMREPELTVILVKFKKGDVTLHEIPFKWRTPSTSKSSHNSIY